MFNTTPNIVNLDAADQVSANKTSKFQIGRDYLVYSIALVIGDTASGSDQAILDNIKEIRLKHGSTVLRTCTGDELNKRNSKNGVEFAVISNGLAAPNRKITMQMYFAEPWRKAYAYHLASLMDTRALKKKCTIEIDFAGATVPSVEAQMLCDESEYPVGGFFTHWERADLALQGNKIDLAPITIEGRLLEIDIKNTAGVFSNVKVGLEAGKTKHDSDDSRNRNFLKQWGLNPSSDRYSIVFDYDDDIMKGPLLNSSSEVKLHFESLTAMAATPAIFEVMKPIV